MCDMAKFNYTVKATTTTAVFGISFIMTGFLETSEPHSIVLASSLKGMIMSVVRRCFSSGVLLLSLKMRVKVGNRHSKGTSEPFQVMLTFVVKTAIIGSVPSPNNM
ncbi:unnamed protein product [Dicrocoelium dendriticum]|nr:unnamed protein product [Dicrocoelium dendriticum]